LRRRPDSDHIGGNFIEQHHPRRLEQLTAGGRTLPREVQREFEDYLKCGRLEHALLRVRCGTCHAEKIFAFSCKRRGICSSCGARRMTESAALLVNEVRAARFVSQH
jgi:hypothetical protein